MFTGKPMSGPYRDIEQMPETPHRGSHHRRAQSETFLRFPDDLLIDPDLDLLNSLDISETPTTSDGAPMDVGGFAKSDSSDSANPKPKSLGPTTTPAHFRSLSVDADFFEGLGFSTSPSGDGADGDGFGGKSSADEKRVRHRHSSSMDGFTSSFEEDSMMAMDGMKKAMPPDRLAELSLIDPKRAKRILANRQSAARSKERKIRYTSELERKVQTLQTEATTLSAQVTMLQRDTSGLTIENKELKLRLQAMEQQAHLREALNEKLREEVQRLKIATGQIPSMNGNAFNRGMPPQYSSHPQNFQHFGSFQNQQQQQQQQQQQPQTQLHMQQSNTNNQSLGRPPQPNFVDFNQRV